MHAFSSAIHNRLSPREQGAVAELVRQIRGGVPADLALAVLFGSKARRSARADSDVDVLLIFRQLPPDREPHASMAEEIAESVAQSSGVPVTIWSVARVDLEPGNRTPMLVDALDDGFPLWPAGAPRLQPRFSAADALRCTNALLQRVREGADEFTEYLAACEPEPAARRARDDLVRLCTAALLLRGVTRPRRAAAARAYRRSVADTENFPLSLFPLLRWAEQSYGPDGKDEKRPVAPPPGGVFAAAAAVRALRDRVVTAERALQLTGLPRR